MYRQGDVLLIPLKPGEKIPDTAKRRMDGVVQLGSSNGNAHAFDVDVAEVLEDGERKFVRVTAPVAQFKHAEHGHQDIPQREYRVQIQRQLTDRGPEDVLD